ncbi:MAG: TetR/AcrR family transcriptional regulator [Oscillochloridaceae bacterium umkhey_bin13]
MEIAEDLQPISAPTALKIIDAAGGLFMQRGYTAVSITDIIKAAEVTKPTLYYYFADKEELFVQMGLRVTNEMGARLREALASANDTPTQLRAVAAVLMANAEADMRMMRHEMAEHLAPAQRARLGRVFYLQIFSPILHLMEEGIASGALGRYPPITLAKMFMAMAESFLEFAPRHNQPWDSQRQGMFGPSDLDPTTLVDLFLNGVRPATS